MNYLHEKEQELRERDGSGQATIVTPASSEIHGTGTQHSVSMPDGQRRSQPLAFALKKLLALFGNPPVVFELPGGLSIAPAGVDPVGRIIIHDRKTAWAIAMDPGFQFGEAYSDGRIEVDGDLIEILTVIYRLMNVKKTWRSLPQRLMQFLRKPRSTRIAKARDNIHHHYDLGNEFYQLWLDEQLVYTCAYFAEPDMTLEQAQVAKLDHVCRKLQLKPDQLVVDAGCGWGALAIHMAEHYGVRVKAFNISREQIIYARDRARRLGLDGRVEFIEDDWRNITGRFDVFASVGMLEHVGVKCYRELGRLIQRCLQPQGLGLIHTIGQNEPRPISSWTERRIFPGGYPPAPSEIMQIFEPCDFSVLDVENLRLHYARTLRHWLARFDAAEERVREMFDEKFIRMWRLYLCGSIAAFESGGFQLFQFLFAPGMSNQVPMTRKPWYQQTAESLDDEPVDANPPSLAR